MIVGQRVISVSRRFDLLRVGEGHVGRESVDQVDHSDALGGRIALGIDQAVIPVVAALSVGTEVDIVGAVFREGHVIVHAFGVPFLALARLRVDDLDLVGRGQRKVVEHILALGRGVLGELVSGVDRPVVHGAHDIVARLILRGRVKGRGIGHVACDSGDLGRPAREGVGEVVVLVLYGRSAVVLGHCTLSYILVGFENGLAVLPCDGVGGSLGGSLGGLGRGALKRELDGLNAVNST